MENAQLDFVTPNTLFLTSHSRPLADADGLKYKWTYSLNWHIVYEYWLPVEDILHYAYQWRAVRFVAGEALTFSVKFTNT